MINTCRLYRVYDKIIAFSLLILFVLIYKLFIINVIGIDIIRLLLNLLVHGKFLIILFEVVSQEEQRRRAEERRRAQEEQERQRRLSEQLAIRQSRDSGFTLLHLLAETGDNTIGQYLQGVGSDINSCTSEGKTALHIAAQFGQLSSIKLLCKYGANIEVYDKDRHTPRDIATMNNYTAIANYLEIKLLKKQFVRTNIEELRDNVSIPQLESKRNLSQWFSLFKISSRSERISSIRNLVFQGGGVSGIAYLGALEELTNEKQEYHLDLKDIRRIGGASAGALTALLVSLGYNPISYNQSSQSELSSLLLEELILPDLLDDTNGMKNLFIELNHAMQTKVDDFYKLNMDTSLDNISKVLKNKDIFNGIIGYVLKQISSNDALISFIQEMMKTITGKFLVEISFSRDFLRSAFSIKGDAYISSIADNRMRTFVKDLATSLLSFNTLEKLLKHLMIHHGIFEGENLRNWVDKQIRKKTICNRYPNGIENATFAELYNYTSVDPYSFLKELYVVGYDVSYGYTQVFSHDHTPSAIVADAVMASMAIPIFFKPRKVYVRNIRSERVSLDSVGEHEQSLHEKIWGLRGHVFMDGGLLDNFPIWLFDKGSYIDSQQYVPEDISITNIQTLGIRLVPNNLIDTYEAGENMQNQDSSYGVLGLLGKVILDILWYQKFQESRYFNVEYYDRVIHIDNNRDKISMVDFDLSNDEKTILIEAGHEAVNRFITRLINKEDELGNAAKENEEGQRDWQCRIL